MGKIERRLKSREEELEMMKGELETYSDAATFVEKLTLSLLTKEEALQNQNARLREFAEQMAKMETHVAET